jgi:hypothetical protein
VFTLKRVNATIEDPLRVPRLAQPETPSARRQYGCLARRSRLLAGCDSGVSAVQDHWPCSGHAQAATLDKQQSKKANLPRGRDAKLRDSMS